MKKIISLFAALLVAAGAMTVTGCATSHDDLDSVIDLSSFYVRGSCGSWDANEKSNNKLTAKGDGSYEYTFKAAAEKVNFAIDDGAWGTTYRIQPGSTDTLVTYKIGNEVEAASGNNANCPELNGLTVGTYYTVKATPLVNTIKIKVVEGEASVPAIMIVGNGTVTPLSYNGTSYEYAFDADDTNVTLTVYSSKNYLKCDSVALGATDAATITKDEKSSNVVKVTGLTAGSPYILTITVGSDEDGNEKITAKVVKDELLRQAAGIGDSFDWTPKNLTKENDGEYSVEFTAKDTSTKFSIQKVAGNWDKRWCGDTDGTDENAVTFTVGTDTAAKKMVYKVGGNPKHAQIKGLETGTTYKITVTVSETNDVSFKVTKK